MTARQKLAAASTGFPAAWGLQGMSASQLGALVQWLGLAKNASWPPIEALALVFCKGMDAAEAGQAAGVPAQDLRRARLALINKLRPWVLEPMESWQARPVTASSGLQARFSKMAEAEAFKARELQAILSSSGRSAPRRGVKPK